MSVPLLAARSLLQFATKVIKPRTLGQTKVKKAVEAQVNYAKGQAKAGTATAATIGVGDYIFDNVSKNEIPEIKKQAKEENIKIKVYDKRINPEDYPTYKKDSDSAKSFRERQKEAKKVGAMFFTWEGRVYNTKEKRTQKKSGGDMKKSTEDQMGELVGVAVSVNPIMEKDGKKEKRKKYQEGNKVSDIITDEEKEYYKNLKKQDQSGMTFASLALIERQIKDYLKGMEDGIISEKDGEKQIAILRETEKKLIAENQREQKQEGGEMDSQMTMMMMPDESKEEMDMLPDDQMEDQHLDFIINESLDNEEEMYLMEQLQADERLSMIFDKIMDTATEFSGSGPVEGLGTEVSDSIPARLSDGEFVMTAKATDEIGSDNLERMMKDAEEASDNRQRVAMGGEIEKKVDRFGKPIDEDLTAEEIKRSMLSVNPRLR